MKVCILLAFFASFWLFANASDNCLCDGEQLTALCFGPFNYDDCPFEPERIKERKGETGSVVPKRGGVTKSGKKPQAKLVGVTRAPFVASSVPQPMEPFVASSVPRPLKPFVASSVPQPLESFVASSASPSLESGVASSTQPPLEAAADGTVLWIIAACLAFLAIAVCGCCGYILFYCCKKREINKRVITANLIDLSEPKKVTGKASFV